MTVTQPPGIQWVVSLVTFSLPEINLKKQMYSFWPFHVDDRSESSSTYDMIIDNGRRSSWRIRHNHELQ
jgi:hypothetical protein